MAIAMPYLTYPFFYMTRHDTTPRRIIFLSINYYYTCIPSYEYTIVTPSHFLNFFVLSTLDIIHTRSIENQPTNGNMKTTFLPFNIGNVAFKAWVDWWLRKIVPRVDGRWLLTHFLRVVKLA